MLMINWYCSSIALDSLCSDCLDFCPFSIFNLVSSVARFFKKNSVALFMVASFRGFHHDYHNYFDCWSGGRCNGAECSHGRYDWF